MQDSNFQLVCRINDDISSNFAIENNRICYNGENLNKRHFFEEFENKAENFISKNQEMVSCEFDNIYESNQLNMHFSLLN